MSYAILEIDLQQPLPELVVPEGSTGIALVLWDGDRPVGFTMQPLEAGGAGRDLRALWEAETGAWKRAQNGRQNRPSAPRPIPLPALTIAVCTRDRPEELQRCLQSLSDLPAADRAVPAAVEILVVDNAPPDRRTRDLVAGFSQVRYVCEPKPGLSFARNRALAEACGDLLVYLDDDVVVGRGWLAGLIEAWRANPDAAAFTGLILPGQLATPAQIVFELRGGFCAYVDAPFEKKRYGPDSPSDALYPCEAAKFGAGANMAFQRAILVELGGFDEALDTGAPLPGGGDLDIFYRLIRAGHTLAYEPKYLVFHRHRRELSALRRQYWGWSLGFTAFLVKSYRTDPSQRAKLRWLMGGWFKYQLGQLLRSLLGRHVLSADMVLAEFYGGLLGLLGGYGRSQRRVERIRQHFDSRLGAPEDTTLSGEALSR